MILNEIQPEDLKGDFYKIRYDKTCGAVYVAGYTSGTVKIGSTAHPMNRFLQLKYSSVEYAGGELEKFALSNNINLLIASVSPLNIYSLNNFQMMGYVKYKMKKLYGGHKRIIFYKFINNVIN